LFSLRDFNTHVMMNSYESEDRAGLKLALAGLVAERILRQHSETEYLLTPEGLSAVRALRNAPPDPPAAEASAACEPRSGVFGRANRHAVSTFDVTFCESAGGANAPRAHKVKVQARDRNTAVDLAVSSLSPEERIRYAVLNVRMERGTPSRRRSAPTKPLVAVAAIRSK
jgi:hypothetical protein